LNSRAPNSRGVRRNKTGMLQGMKESGRFRGASRTQACERKALRGLHAKFPALVQTERNRDGAAIMTQMVELMPASELFKGRQFDREVIVLCVRWYLSFKLSSRDLVEIMSERRIALAHTTILRWVQRYVPEFEKLWKRYARAVGGSWRCDETYIKVKGRWTYLYRAVDKQGRTADFLLSEKRDVAAAKRFFGKAMKNNGTPRVITLDAYAATHRAVAEMKSARTMPRRVGLRSSKYLNNMIEQDHRRIKHRIGPMLGFKRFDTAAVTISGIELAEKIKKHQFKIGKLAGRPKTAPEIWAAVLAA
jgi:transposase-like protein